ncbi:Uncharacterised protein family (UPF0236) [Alicyclobacillus vulcanalis]|uniref:Uncharacterized protein family (UPF0236) n=1 Tax=Alicyclobacillus vulcanalis TaxID=252246 RepID=A0A1N7NM78_9BACL|nr:Uncharacterised protein family (UPF0236) [Alicyclobacillus vulcanalis]
MEPHRRLSPQLRSQAIALAMEMSYRRAASLLQAWVPEVSAMAIWEEVQRLGEEERAKAERAREEVFEQGMPTPGKRAVETLHVEADGVYVRRTCRMSSGCGTSLAWRLVTGRRRPKKSSLRGSGWAKPTSLADEEASVWRMWIFCMKSGTASRR